MGILNYQLKETPWVQTQSCDIKGQRQHSIYNKINIVYTCVTHLSEKFRNGSRHCQATFTRDVFDGTFQHALIETPATFLLKIVD